MRTVLVVSAAVWASSAFGQEMATDPLRLAVERDSVTADFTSTGRLITRRLSMVSDSGCTVTLRSRSRMEDSPNEPQSVFLTKVDLSELSSDIYLRVSDTSAMRSLMAYANVASPSIETMRATINESGEEGTSEVMLRATKPPAYITISVFGLDSNYARSADAANRISRGLSTSIKRCGGSALNEFGKRNRKQHVDLLQAYAILAAAEPEIKKELLGRCKATIRAMVRAPTFSEGDVVWFGSPSERIAFGDVEATTSYGGRSAYSYLCEYRRYSGGWIPASAPVVKEKY